MLMRNALLRSRTLCNTCSLLLTLGSLPVARHTDSACALAANLLACGTLQLYIQLLGVLDEDTVGAQTCLVVFKDALTLAHTIFGVRGRSALSELRVQAQLRAVLADGVLHAFTRLSLQAVSWPEIQCDRPPTAEEEEDFDLMDESRKGQLLLLCVLASLMEVLAECGPSPAAHSPAAQYLLGALLVDEVAHADNGPTHGLQSAGVRAMVSDTSCTAAMTLWGGPCPRCVLTLVPLLGQACGTWWGALTQGEGPPEAGAAAPAAASQPRLLYTPTQIFDLSMRGVEAMFTWRKPGDDKLLGVRLADHMHSGVLALRCAEAALTAMTPRQRSVRLPRLWRGCLASILGSELLEHPDVGQLVLLASERIAEPYNMGCDPEPRARAAGPLPGELACALDCGLVSVIEGVLRLEGISLFSTSPSNKERGVLAVRPLMAPWAALLAHGPILPMASLVIALRKVMLAERIMKQGAFAEGDDGSLSNARQRPVSPHAPNGWRLAGAESPRTSLPGWTDECAKLLLNDVAAMVGVIGGTGPHTCILDCGDGISRLPGAPAGPETVAANARLQHTHQLVALSVAQWLPHVANGIMQQSGADAHAVPNSDMAMVLVRLQAVSGWFALLVGQGMASGQLPLPPGSSVAFTHGPAIGLLRGDVATTMASWPDWMIMLGTLQMADSLMRWCAEQCMEAGAGAGASASANDLELQRKVLVISAELFLVAAVVQPYCAQALLLASVPDKLVAALKLRQRHGLVVALLHVAQRENCQGVHAVLDSLGVLKPWFLAGLRTRLPQPGEALQALLPDGVCSNPFCTSMHKASEADLAAELGVCGRCGGPRYCQRSCQKDHWQHGGHKAACALAQKAKKAAEAAAAQLPSASNKVSGVKT